VHDLQVFGVARALWDADKAERVSRHFFQTGKMEDSAAPVQFQRPRFFAVPNHATARALEPSIVSRLARFFPEATAVRIPIRLSRARSHAVSEGDGPRPGGAHESAFLQDTVIEYGTLREVLFIVDHPLEFADRVLVESSDGTLHAEASVVAVQYHPQRTVVAVRFAKQVPNWIVKS
jgi:hypothetical protein